MVMSGRVQLPDFSHLSVSERILLVEQIWDSIVAEQASLPVTEAKKFELDRRLDACREFPAPGASWEPVKTRLQAQKPGND
jgi:putative addiction module component (TIGR02574 family)